MRPGVKTTDRRPGMWFETGRGERRRGRFSPGAEVPALPWASDFGGDEILEIGERAEAGEFVGLEGQLKGGFDQDNEFREGERIEREVLDEADLFGGGLQFRAEGTRDVVLDDAVENRGEMGGVALRPEANGGEVGRRRAVAEQNAEFVGGGGGGVHGEGCRW